MNDDSWGIIGTSQKILDVLEIIRRVADTDVAVLIQGESGTGKELVARAVHGQSSRVNGENVSVNCGAIHEGILESELFGHEKGSFTGATARRIGYFELANNGTIFLDEIGEMSLITQVKLLRVLELGEFIRVGGSKKLVTNARIIASTNKDLEQEVQRGNFRQDLFYRLKSITITLPPLRERGQDLEMLISHFIKELEQKYAIKHNGFGHGVIEGFYNYSWPGNIRELKNLLESLVLLKKGGTIELADLPESIKNNQVGISGLPVHVNKTTDQAERELIYRALLGLRVDVEDLKTMMQDLMHLHRRQSGIPQLDRSFGDVSGLVDIGDDEFEDFSVEKIEADTIQKALHRFNGNRKRAAKVLGISERTLYRRLKDM